MPRDITEGLTGPGMRLCFASCALYCFPLQPLTLSPHLLLMSELCYCQASFTEKIGIISRAFLEAYEDKKISQFHVVLSASVLIFQLQIISIFAVMPAVLRLDQMKQASIHV